jgi:hypothetical protein
MFIISPVLVGGDRAEATLAVNYSKFVFIFEKNFASMEVIIT